MSDPLIVLFGGTSSERLVSVASAQHLVEVLGPVETWFISAAGAVHRCSAQALLRHQRPFERDFEPEGPSLWGSLGEALDQLPSRNSVFFLALHGGSGEDGTVQAEFERRGVAFTGSGSKASRRAFDKTIAKELVRSRGVRTASAELLPVGDGAQAAQALEAFFVAHGRSVVKPMADGSSVGLHHLLRAEQVPEIATEIGRQKRPYLVEEFVQGVELTVGVVDGLLGRRALSPSEVRVEEGRAFDYAGKYLGRGTREITPAEVPVEVAKEAQRVALLAHEAVGCEGYSRTDMIVGSKGPVFLEINNLPGLTRASFVPQQLAAEGTDMRAFLFEQAELAVRRRIRASSAA